jgi:hypothetical protein
MLADSRRGLGVTDAGSIFNFGHLGLTRQNELLRILDVIKVCTREDTPCLQVGGSWFGSGR